MSAVQLISYCRDAGIRLQARGDRLHVEAPPGTMTPELRQQLVDHKADLLALHAVRAHLLALAIAGGIDVSHVHQLHSLDIAACVGLDARQLAAYLTMLTDTAERHAGRVPAGDTAMMHCQQCGPVWIHPDIVAALPMVNGWPRALGCPWCFVRKAGGPIPRPEHAMPRRTQTGA